MFDDLLGRTELKEEIAALEAELVDLEERVDREARKRKDAVTEKQEAQRKANRLEDRIAQLEDERDRLRSDEVSMTERRDTTVRGQQLSEILDRLDSVRTGREGALTAFIEDGRNIPFEVRDAFGDRTALVSRATPCLALTDDAGLLSLALRPPIEPDPFHEWNDSFTIDRSWLEPRGRYTLALVRSDLFAMGTYQGDEQVGFHGFDSELKSRHSKGGFSQARFERLRDEQIDDHLDRCVVALEEQDADALYVVGERSVLGEVMHLADATTTVDATGDPEEALEDAWRDFWTVQLRIF